MLRVCVLLSVVAFLSIIWLPQDVRATKEAINFFIDNSEAVGLKLPGYVKLLTDSRSSFLSRLLHYIFKERLETAASNLMTATSKLMPPEVTIEDIENVNRMSLKKGKLKGLDHIILTPKGQVNVIFDNGLPAFTIPVQFKKLEISFSFKQDLGIITKRGLAKASIVWNNIVLKFRLTLRITRAERCFLNLYDVIFTDMEDLDFHVYRTGGPTGGLFTGVALDAIFSATDSEVEEHMKKAIADTLYYEIPVASPVICDNAKRSFQRSSYHTEHKKIEEKVHKVQDTIMAQNAQRSKPKTSR